jgi:thymidylate synthase ThyX
MINAEVVCDSINGLGDRLTTFQLRYPKFIHGEFMTHRKFSRNASSSRAVPTMKLIAEVLDPEQRARPVFWGKNQPGMQAEEELADGGRGSDKQRAIAYWDAAAHHAGALAGCMDRLGVHKQIVNRIMEPFLHINTLCSATDYMNFFGLRLDKAAQPEMRALAEAMWRAYGESRPKVLLPGDWHLPFLSEQELERLVCMTLKAETREPFNEYIWAIKVSVARCARVSYMSNDTGKRSMVEEDIRLYREKLRLPEPMAPKDFVPDRPIHASPAEHQATPDEPFRLEEYRGDRNAFRYECEWGNFQGWRQFRKMLPGEAHAPLPKEYQK